MSALDYDDTTHTLTLTTATGERVGAWTAHNNVSSGSGGVWPAGTFDFSWHSRHDGGTADSAYGSNGNFIFDVPGRTGMGVHSGRSSTADGRSRSGTQHATEGCIRTSDQATAQIEQTHRGDPLTEITVRR
jgi:hypothetical protein